MPSSINFVSASFHNLDQDEGFHDHAVTILLVAWGQFIDHDITLTAETKDIRHAKIIILKMTSSFFFI